MDPGELDLVVTCEPMPMFFLVGRLRVVRIKHQNGAVLEDVGQIQLRSPFEESDVKLIVALVLFAVALTAGLTTFAIMSTLPGWATVSIIVLSIVGVIILAALGTILAFLLNFGGALLFGISRR